MCSLCDGGKADWGTFVIYEGKSIACGDFEWILRGEVVAAGSDQCAAVKGEFQDKVCLLSFCYTNLHKFWIVLGPSRMSFVVSSFKCCYEPPGTSCNLCHKGQDYLDVSGEVQIVYQGAETKCLNLYNSLFVREAADSNQCQAAKDEHAEACCFEKCKVCEFGSLDTSATVNVEGAALSCSALEMSFSKDVVVEGSTQCSAKRAEYAAACCYTSPENPCKVCPTGSDVKGDVSVNFYGETKSCADIGNKLALSEEAESESCAATQQDFSRECCFERCPICPDGFNLNWEVDVEYNRATIACGELDGIISGTAIQKSSQECDSLRSTFSSACCYNYATATYAEYAAETILGQISTTGFLSTNLDTSTLTPAQKEDAKIVFQNLIRNTLEAEAVLPRDSTVTVTDIDDNGVVQYKIVMNVDDSVIASVDSDVDSTPASAAEMEQILSDSSILVATAESIQAQAPGASDATVAEILTAVDVIAFKPAGTSPVAPVAPTTGVLETNLNTSSLTAQQKVEVIGAMESAIVNTLQTEGVLSEGDTVTVTDIVGEGVVLVSVDSSNTPEIALSLSNPSSLVPIVEAVKAQAPGASDASVAAMMTAVDVIAFKPVGTSPVAPVAPTTGVLETNLNTSSLTALQKEEVIGAVESAIVNTLQTEGVLSEGDTVTVTDIVGEGVVLVSVDSSNTPEITQSLSNPSSLVATAGAIQAQAPGASDATVAEILTAVDVIAFKPAGTSPVAPVAPTTGVLETNLNTSSLTAQQKVEVIGAVESAIVNTLQTEGVLSEGDTVTVTDIVGEGVVLVSVDSSNTPEIAHSLSNPSSLVPIVEAVKAQAPGASDASVAAMMTAVDVIAFKPVGTSPVAPVAPTTGVLETNLNTSSLTAQQKVEVIGAVESAIVNTLQTEGVLSEGDTVTVTDIVGEGVVLVSVDSSNTPEITQSLSNPSILVPIVEAIQAQAPGASDASVAAMMTTVDVIAFKPVGTSPVAPVAPTTGVLETNLNTSSLTAQQKVEVIGAVESAIVNTLQTEGVLSEGDTVTVTDIVGEGVVLVSVDSSNTPEIAHSLSNPSSLVPIVEAVKAQAPGASDASVAAMMTAVDVIAFKPVGTSPVAPVAPTTGVLETNLNTSSLTAQQKVEVIGAVESAIVNTLQTEGVLSEGDTVTVTDIVGEGVVLVSVDSSNTPEIALSLSNPSSLVATAGAIQAQAPGASDASVAAMMTAVDVIAFKPVGTSPVVPLDPNAAVFETNINTSGLTAQQKDEVIVAVESAIVNSLQTEGVLSEGDTVTVTDIDGKGDVVFAVDPSNTPRPPPPTETNLQTIANAVVSNIDATLQNTTTLQEISGDLQAESANSSVSQALSNVSVTNFVQGEISTSAAVGTAATGAGPCNLCNVGEIGLEKQILFNGAQTSCSQVYKFLATQEEAGSDACTAGKEALHKECCLKKCDLCSNGGIPDWYSMVNVNGKTMTCLELDGIVTESQIQSGSDQCSQLLEVAAPACCYVPPTEPCHMCKNGFGFDDVKFSFAVEYGGSNTTCGQIFNTLFSREEHDSESCSLISQDLASKCCYDQCSLCGGLQTDAAITVAHDDAKLGCSEFDSNIFSSNLIEEGSNECKAFQSEHRKACCYDIACSLCAKGDDIYTTKESSMVQYGGSQVSCGEVANFLFEQEMSQSNVCLAAQENIFSDCCFQQCEICDAGSSINWAATTNFNKQSQSCTDVYWLLVSESVEAGTEACSGLSQVSKDCCYKVPSQQCTLCKDDNGATYNTRWNTEVTVNGMTKTCGDFNTLLATQESESQTCSMAKEAIFNDCCFAGSDALVAVADQLSAETDASCRLCKPGQIGIDAEIVFNNNPTTCEEVYIFLIDGFQESSTTCKSAQVKLSVNCCQDQDNLSPSEKPAFGSNSTGIDGEGSITAEGPVGEKIIPPLEFEAWTRKPSGAKCNSSLGRLCTAIIVVFAIELFLFG
jgi:hypothetical protein